MAPIIITREKYENTDERHKEEDYMLMETEIGIMKLKPRNKNCQQPLEVRRVVWSKFSLRVSRGTNHDDTQILDFWSHKL